MAWVVGLIANCLLMIYLWSAVASWATEEQSIALVFSDIEVEAVDQAEVEFSLPDSAEPEEVEVAIEDTLVEVLTVNPAETDWAQESAESMSDSLAEGLFETIDPGVGAAEGNSKGDGKGASFFGLESTGDRLVFVVDCSGSMGYEMRFQRASYELSQSLRMMEADQEFLVVLYNDRIYPMLDTPLKETKPLKATEKNVERVLDWLAYQRPVGSTLPARAILGALEVQPTSIFFLSDGELADDTRELLWGWNRHNSGEGLRKVPIHTITLGSTGVGAGMMQRIAKENDGQFHWAK